MEKPWKRGVWGDLHKTGLEEGKGLGWGDVGKGQGNVFGISGRSLLGRKKTTEKLAF